MAKVTKKTTTAIAKKEGGALVDARLESYGDLMDDSDIDASDILIPKILMMQGLSPLVADEKAKMGELRGSLEGNLLAKKGEQVELIFLKKYKTWVNFSTATGKEEFLSIEPFTPANANLAREEGDVKRYETLNYYVLSAAELQNESFMPYVISFRSTNYKRGKIVESFRAKMKEFGKPLCFKTLKLGTEQVENDKGKFYISTIEEGRDTTDEELSKVKHWFKLIDGGLRVDDSAEHGETAVADDGEGDF